jgi:hypothetical protein
VDEEGGRGPGNCIRLDSDSKTASGVAEVPLTEFAVEAFRKQIAISGPGPYLFPNPDNPSGCQASFKKVRPGDDASEGGDSIFSDLRPPIHVCNSLERRDAKVLKKYSQMKLQIKREALAKLNRKAHDKESSGTGDAA